MTYVITSLVLNRHFGFNLTWRHTHEVNKTSNFDKLDIGLNLFHRVLNENIIRSERRIFLRMAGGKKRKTGEKSDDKGKLARVDSKSNKRNGKRREARSKSKERSTE